MKRRNQGSGEKRDTGRHHRKCGVDSEEKEQMEERMEADLHCRVVWVRRMWMRRVAAAIRNGRRVGSCVVDDDICIRVS